MQPLISVCIPAYQQPQLLDRCLQSLADQDYPFFEVIITDDTPGESIKLLADQYKPLLKLHYEKNSSALGSPANWNAALQKATGELVLLLHHDDWLTVPTALSQFVAAFEEHIDCTVVFSKAVSILPKVQRAVTAQKQRLQKVWKHPFALLLGNVIGPPSVLMLRRSAVLLYDTRYKWLVDIEYYIRLLLRRERFYFLDRHLVSVGIHAGQVTQSQILSTDILQEHLLLAAQWEAAFANDRSAYDHYWRLLRNHNVRTQSALKEASAPSVPQFIRQIVRHQSRIPKALLEVGVFSKLFMTLSFLRSEKPSPSFPGQL